MPSPITDINPRPQKRTKKDFLDDVTVLVGLQRARFVVHENVICRSSKFFEAAVNGNWKEATDKTAALPDTRSVAFGVYLGWLYTGKVEVEEDPQTKPTTHHSWDEVCALLTDAYALGDYLQDATFSNAVVDETMRTFEEEASLPGPDVMRYFWDRISPCSTFAKLLVDYIATDFEIETFEDRVSEYPTGFVAEIAKVCVREREMSYADRRPHKRPKCYYHEHENDCDECE